MKYLCIDYGKKFVGLAISDDSGRVAFPYDIIKNDANLFENLFEVFSKESIEGLVLGLSLDLNGKENDINKEIKKMGQKIEIEYGIPVLYENEVYSSVQAKRGIYKPQKPNSKFSKESLKTKEERVDDKAATIVLQFFLDKISQ